MENVGKDEFKQNGRKSMVRFKRETRTKLVPFDNPVAINTTTTYGKFPSDGKICSCSILEKHVQYVETCQCVLMDLKSKCS